MADYYIDIIDTLDDTHVTIHENAKKDGIVLKYRGSDDVDGLGIVGSVLSFDVNVPRTNKNDAVFIGLFTGNEIRYRTELRREIDDLLIWQGFILPDSYSEPYTNGTYFVSFEASDGLGRLKGKYLPEDYYQEEKSIVDIICQCLLLTGLQMPLIIAPAIDNEIEKDWNKIYVDTQNFTDDEKKHDAHKILSILVSDLISCIYQHLGNWYFVGLNKHSLSKFDAKLYDVAGHFVQDWEVQKTVKTATANFSQTPIVTMMAPYNVINVEYAAESVFFDENLWQENNDGWIADDTISAEIMATEWYGHNGYFAYAQKPKYNVVLKSNGLNIFEPSKFVSLKNKIYLRAGQKIGMVLKFKTDPAADHWKQNAINGGFRTNNFRYEIKLNDQILFTNNRENVSTFETVKFESNDAAQLGFEFIATENGLLDLVFYQPYGNQIDAAMKGVFIEELEIFEVAFNNDGFKSDVVNEEYTSKKEIELTFTDNAAGLGSVFQLAKLKVPNKYVYNIIDVRVLYSRVFQGQNMAIVSLQSANIVKDNINSVYIQYAEFIAPEILENVQVIYNFNNGEEMVIITEDFYPANTILKVRQHKTIDYSLNRQHWQSWTDSVYEVEKKRYVDIVIGIFRRLFDVPKQKIDGTVKMPILFADIVEFNYLQNQNYYITNTSINFDSGDSNITMVKAGYAQSESGNLPPFVDCGPDVFITEFQTDAFLNATAFDPDGTIESYVWEKISGPAGDIIVTPGYEDTALANLTGNEYEYRLTVTDNGGLSASDTVKVLRQFDYTIEFELISHEEIIEDDEPYGYNMVLINDVYRLKITPDIPDGSYINFNFLMTAISPNFNTNDGQQIREIAYAGIRKNNVFTTSLTNGPGVGSNSSRLDLEGVLNYVASDEIEIYINTVGNVLSWGVSAPAVYFTIQSGQMYNTPGNLLNLPNEIKIERN